VVTIGPYYIELVPEGSWEKTPSQLARRQQTFKARWEAIKRRELERADFRCEICRADGLLECTEMWSFDDDNHVQKLVGYKVVCPGCLSILRINRTVQLGDLEMALSHFMRVTGFSEDDLKAATSAALNIWKRRSQQNWRLDLGLEPLARGSGRAPAQVPERTRPRAPKGSPRPSANPRHDKPPGELTSFSPEEISFLKSQRLLRIATSSKRAVPEVSPVGFEYDGRYFWIGSHSQSIFFKTRRYRNISGGNSRVSLVIDDLVSVDPWRPRGIKVSGTAEIMDHDGIFGKGKYFRVTPRVSVSWGIEKPREGQWTSRKTFA